MKLNLYVKFFTFLFSSLALLMSFQNCAQSNNSNSSIVNTISTPTTNSGESMKVAEIDLSKSTNLELQLNSLFSTDSSREKPNLDINLANGEMRFINQERHFLNNIRYCLIPEELAELKTIIYSAKICVPEEDLNANSNVVCTQQYIFPYAKVKLESSDIIKFGEKAGCVKSLDFCEDSKKAVNGFISYLASRIDNRKCL